ncbi:hypothetical protein [Actinomadura macrotermitis]|uniref:Uncharacterized protein n=1 Tax=Actinomadura macrotermitis TaxID=2585200 RepID=A0A7K0C3Q1_9ACTN|nr:hypothetical protein [Actinomadura macrotermitis]MQY07722.1 hypothetical protein [Actinomadura macrotermitis]
MSTLEDRYRRLLACYPAAHRAEHGQEMLDVLLAGAGPGQTRPSLADTADLLLGAARIRLRQATAGTGAPGWPAALSVTGLLATLLLLADGLRFALNVPSTASLMSERRAELGEPLRQLLVLYFGTAPYWLAWAVIAVLVWRGARRPAAIATCAVTGVQVAAACCAPFAPGLPGGLLMLSLAGFPLPLALLATASLVASPGPGHGARLLGRRRIAVAAALAVLLVALTSHPLVALITPDPTPGSIDNLDETLWRWSVSRGTALLTAAVLIAASLAHTRHGRRACALLAIPLAPLLATEAEMLINGSVVMQTGPFRPLAIGLLGFGAVLLAVRLAEAPGQGRDRLRTR